MEFRLKLEFKQRLNHTVYLLQDNERTTFPYAGLN